MRASDEHERVLRHRLRAQRIAPRAADDVTVGDLVGSVCGIQAQEKPAAALSVRARRRGLTATDVERALYDERSVVRTWCMRGTFHLVATEDLPWLLAVFGPTFATRGPDPRRLAAWGLDEERVEAVVETIGEVLADEGPLTREDIAEHLVDRGIEVDPATQAVYHLIRRAALRGVVCEVAPIDGTNAYDRLDSWVDLDPTPDHDDALATLARRYLAAYGPATRADFAAWSGLYAKDVKTAWASLADDARELETDAGEALMLEQADSDDPPTESLSVRLLPGYDTYLLGYKKDHRPVPDGYESHVWPGSAIIRPTVVVDGRVVGTWRLDRSRKTMGIDVTPFESLDEGILKGVEREATDVGRFLDESVECRVLRPD